MLAITRYSKEHLERRHQKQRYYSFRWLTIRPESTARRRSGSSDKRYTQDSSFCCPGCRLVPRFLQWGAHLVGENPALLLTYGK
jgi:hypothetical protein